MELPCCKNFISQNSHWNGLNPLCFNKCRVNEFC